MTVSSNLTQFRKILSPPLRLPEILIKNVQECHNATIFYDVCKRLPLNMDLTLFFIMAGRRSPLSPLQNLMGQLRSKVDRQLFDSRTSSPAAHNMNCSCAAHNASHGTGNVSCGNLNSTSTADDNISPGLARLRNTPGTISKIIEFKRIHFGQLSIWPICHFPNNRTFCSKLAIVKGETLTSSARYKPVVIFV